MPLSRARSHNLEYTSIFLHMGPHGILARGLFVIIVNESFGFARDFAMEILFILVNKSFFGFAPPRPKCSSFPTYILLTCPNRFITTMTEQARYTVRIWQDSSYFEAYNSQSWTRTCLSSGRTARMDINVFYLCLCNIATLRGKNFTHKYKAVKMHF